MYVTMAGGYYPGLPLRSAKAATVAPLSRKEKDPVAGEARRKKMAVILSALGKAGIGAAAVVVVKSAAVAATAWTTAPAMIAVFAAAATTAVVAGTWEYHAQKGDKKFSWKDWAYSVNHSSSAKKAFGFAIAGGVAFSFLADIVQGFFGGHASPVAGSRISSGVVTYENVPSVEASAPEVTSVPESVVEKSVAVVQAAAPVVSAPVPEVIPDYTNMPPVSDVTDAQGVRTIVHASGIVETNTPIYAPSTEAPVSAPVTESVAAPVSALAPTISAVAPSLPAVGVCDVIETESAVKIDCTMDPKAVVQPGSGIDFRSAAQPEPFRVGLSLESEPQPAMEFLENHAIPEAREAFSNGRFSPKP